MDGARRITAGTDMAPWYQGAAPTGMFGVRWVAEDNKDSFYTCLNNINRAEFRHFEEDNQAAGHDNFNYLVTTWQHTFNQYVHTQTEAYFMWQHDAELGGTPSLGPVEPYGGGGGDGELLPGWSYAYGVLNYTEFATSKKDFISIRNEWYRDSAACGPATRELTRATPSAGRTTSIRRGRFVPKSASTATGRCRRSTTEPRMTL